VTVEPDEELAARAPERLPREVEVICADWRVLLDREFVFVDGGGEATKTDPDVMRLLGDRRGRASPARPLRRGRRLRRRRVKTEVSRSSTT
jgi:hypothetical protein